MQCNETFPVSPCFSCDALLSILKYIIIILFNIFHRVKTYTPKYTQNPHILVNKKRQKSETVFEKWNENFLMLNRLIHMLGLTQFVNRMKKMPQSWIVAFVILCFTTWNQIWADQRHAWWLKWLLLCPLQQHLWAVSLWNRNKRKWKKCSYVHCVVIHLLCVIVCLVWHQKRFDQILIETVSKASDGDMIYNVE